jgi:signal transduction histidine kinase/DNA-binding response OmpR family regulator
VSQRILIVDDNAVTRKLVRVSLSDFEVIEAPNAITARTLAREQAPDLILQDLVLPDIDGFVLLEELRAVVGSQVPILAFTGLMSHAIEARMGGARFDDVISKPIAPTRLREIVRGYFPDRIAASGVFGAGRRIVLADDDDVQRKLAAYRLVRMGFEVFAAADGEQALAMARQQRPHVIVSDVLMPKMDGFELCARVRADDLLAGTPVVLLTNSYLEDSDFDLAKRVGADSYLVRTPELTELASVLDKTLRSPVARVITPQPPSPDVQSERVERALRQLDRQVALNGALTQRNVMLSAELTILSGLTSALAEHGDPDAALDTALTACFDAGGISWGVLLVATKDGWNQRAIGLSAATQLRSGPELERAAATVGRATAPRRIAVQALAASEAGSTDVLVAPIVHGEELLGALMLGAGDELDEHRAAFAAVVAGQIALTLAMARTIRAYEEATAAERRRVRLLQSTLDAIDDPILVLDPTYQTTHWNRAAERMGLLRRPDDPRQWPQALSLFEPDQRTPFPWEQLPMIRALEGGPVVRAEMVALPEGEPPVWLSVHARAVQSEDGGTESAVAVLRDVTAEKLAQMHHVFADRMASLGVLAAGVAHEINNPLGVVVAELDMALEDTEGTPVHTGLALAREGADRVRIIVRDLKTLSRGETDEIELLDLRRPIESALRMASAETRSRALIVRELSEVPSIAANEARLGQVFLNLIVNAAHAIPKGRVSSHRITVRTWGDASHVYAEVADTGSGMTPEVRARLFTPFFTTKEIGVGSGLGLSVSRHIVTAAGGRIEVQSELDEGTTFRLTFPIASSATARPPRSNAE